MSALNRTKQCQRSSSATAIRRASDDTVSLVLSEYSDEIRHRNQREDRKLENARRYLDRACRVVSNEMDQQRATIMRSLARTRHVASAAAASAPGDPPSPPAATGPMARRRDSAEAKRPASSTSANNRRGRREVNGGSAVVGYEPLHHHHRPGTGTSSGGVQASNGMRKTPLKQIGSRERPAELDQNNSSADDDSDDDLNGVKWSPGSGQSAVKRGSNLNRPVISINRPIIIGSKGFGSQKYRYLPNKDSSHSASNVNEIRVLNPRPETKQ